MSNTSRQPDSGTTAAGLLLQVSRADGSIREMYLADGLSIGRSQANAIQLAGDDQVERNHARVEYAPDGTARLVCLGTDTHISLGSTNVRELGLSAGVRFRIGQSQFECLQGLRHPYTGPAPLVTSCPFCSSQQQNVEQSGPQECPTCHRPLFMLPNIPGFRDAVVVPQLFGDNQAQQFVARGGMGLVLRGVRKSDQVPVAIKLLLSDRAVNRQAAERFKQEIAMMRRVRHPNVVNLLSYGREGRFNYLVMEWIEGGSLREVIAASKRVGRLVPFQTAIQWLEQVCKGLAAMHAVGVMHRDLKPSNILTAANGAARVSDLGIAKSIHQVGTELTKTGEMPGTDEYMAPEQHSAPDTVDGRADLYALGVTFYELLSGERPTGAWLSASKVNPTVPIWFDAVLAKLLSRNPSTRYADIHDLLAALSWHDKNEPGSKSPDPAPLPPVQERPQVIRPSETRWWRQISEYPWKNRDLSFLSVAGITLVTLSWLILKLLDTDSPKAVVCQMGLPQGWTKIALDSNELPANTVFAADNPETGIRLHVVRYWHAARSKSLDNFAQELIDRDLAHPDFKLRSEKTQFRIAQPYAAIRWQILDGHDSAHRIEQIKVYTLISDGQDFYVVVVSMDWSDWQTIGEDLDRAIRTFHVIESPGG